jgi:hypothetical protein
MEKLSLALMSFITCLFLMFIFSSCKQYGDHIVGADFADTRGVFRPIDSLTLDSAYRHYVMIDSNHAGNPQVFMMYRTVEPSAVQKWSVAKHNGTLWVGILFVLLALASAILGFIWTINVPKWKLAPVACGLMTVVWLWCFGGAVDWAHTKNADIPVWQYDQEMKTKGNLSDFWATHLYN